MIRWLPRARDTGQAAEQQAERHLKAHGLKGLARNFHARGGEIDLIMTDQQTLVFVEVRFRRNITHGSALESITPQKQARIRKAASYFLQQHPEMAERSCRFDVIGIEPGPGNSVTIDWIQNAFT